MVVRESLYPWPQHCGPRLIPAEVRYKVGTAAPDTVRVRIEGREDVEQVSDVRVLRSDPPRFAEPRLVRFEVTQSLEPTEVVILGRAEEWGCPWISGSKIVAEGLQSSGCFDMSEKEHKIYRRCPFCRRLRETINRGHFHRHLAERR